MNVSVIINTLNRDYWLKRVLESLMLQTYDDFEIVVVNGPSIDDTDRILQPYKSAIKVEKCDVPNISVSRNIGIKAAAGEIIIFIDDDAVPMGKHWIEHYVKAFENNPKLGCIGGKVYDGRGYLQFDSGYVDIWGHPFCVPSHESSKSASRKFKYAQGCNCAFLRKAVVEAGGFDEYIEYYLDESDVAVRLAKNGYEISHHPLANVYHEGARGPGQKSRFLDYFKVVVKNQVYFGYKSSEGESCYDLNTRKHSVLKEANEFKNSLKTMTKAGEITKEEYMQYLMIWEKAVKIGEHDGLYSKRKIRFDLDCTSDFKKINRESFEKQLAVCFLLHEPPHSNGGLTKYTKELIQGLAKLGVSVHVIYCGDENVEYMELGVCYYSIKPFHLPVRKLDNYPMCSSLLKYSYNAYKKILMLIEMYGIKIVESPLWNYMGLISAEFLSIPVVTRLQTPAKVVGDVHQYSINDDHLLYYEFERRLVGKSVGIIAISECISRTIEEAYEVDFKGKLYKNYLGIDDVKFKEAEGDRNKIIVFFIGRLERRKGIANLFDVIPNVLKKHENVEFRFAGTVTHDVLLGMTFVDYFQKKYRKYQANVVFLGEISDEEKESELAGCDIFAAPSIYESFGIIYIEAMRHAKPVVGCNAGGVPEVVLDGETGLLCEPNNSAELEKALLALIENKPMREKMGKEGYRRFKDMFTQEKMAKGALEIYKKVINGYSTNLKGCS